MSLENETGSVWSVITSYLALNRKDDPQNQGEIILKKNDFIFVLSENANRNILLTRLGIAEEFFVWQKYCMRIA